jgi:hypothetical protein
MSKDLVIYWSNVPDNDVDWSIIFEEPKSLLHELSLNKNKNNQENNLLRCPAVTDLCKNLFVIKNPLYTKASFIIKNNMVSNEMKSDDGKWLVNRPPSFNNQLLAMYIHPIIFFAEEDVEIMLTNPYFSNIQHSSWGAIVPGIFNCGSWFRPVQMEFNVWENIKEVELLENEHIAYIKFFTEKRVVLKRFTMNEDLMNQAKICSGAGKWEPKVPLIKRYLRFKNSKRDKFILSKIKENIV